MQHFFLSQKSYICGFLQNVSVNPLQSTFVCSPLPQFTAT